MCCCHRPEHSWQAALGTTRLPAVEVTGDGDAVPFDFEIVDDASKVPASVAAHLLPSSIPVFTHRWVAWTCRACRSWRRWHAWAGTTWPTRLPARRRVQPGGPWSLLPLRCVASHIAALPLQPIDPQLIAGRPGHGPKRRGWRDVGTGPPRRHARRPLRRRSAGCGVGGRACLAPIVCPIAPV
jgi:hypothetical protein